MDDWIDLGASFLTGTGAMVDGLSKSRAKKAEAKSLRRNANARQAAGTRQSHEERRKGDIVASQAAAISAASGGAMDAGMIERMARIKSDTDYNVLASIYTAETDASNMRYAAKISETEGKAAKMGGMMRAIPSILDLGDKAYDLWGKKDDEDITGLHSGKRSNRL